MSHMNESDRRAAISRRVADHAEQVGEPVSAGNVCEVCVETLSVDGCVLSPISARGRWTLAYTLGERARDLADLQFTLGEGPRVEAVNNKNAVLVDDLTTTQAAEQWPLFTPSAADAGISAVFTFPLTPDGMTAGVLQLYRGKPGDLSDEERIDAAVFADLALSAMVDHYDAADDTSIAEMQMGERAVVYQATGMIAAVLDLTPDEALVRLKFHAYAQSKPITDVAQAITTGKQPPSIDLCPVATDGHRSPRIGGPLRPDSNGSAPRSPSAGIGAALRDIRCQQQFAIRRRGIFVVRAPPISHRPPGVPELAAVPRAAGR